MQLTSGILPSVGSRGCLPPANCCNEEKLGALFPHRDKLRVQQAKSASLCLSPCQQAALLPPTRKRLCCSLTPRFSFPHLSCPEMPQTRKMLQSRQEGLARFCYEAGPPDLCRNLHGPAWGLDCALNELESCASGKYGALTAFPPCIKERAHMGWWKLQTVAPAACRIFRPFYAHAASPRELQVPVRPRHALNQS